MSTPAPNSPAQQVTARRPVRSETVALANYPSTIITNGSEENSPSSWAPR